MNPILLGLTIILWCIFLLSLLMIYLSPKSHDFGVEYLLFIAFVFVITAMAADDWDARHPIPKVQTITNQVSVVITNK